MEPLAVTGVGIVSALGVGRSAVFEALSDPAQAQSKAFGQPNVLDAERCPGAIAAEAWGFEAADYLGDKGLRNFDRLTKFLIVCAKLALEDAAIKREGEHLGPGPDRVGVCSATAYGSLDAITELNLVAELEDPRFLNPNRFPNTVINSPAAYVSIWEDLRAPNVTIVDGNCGALDALLTSETHLVNGRADAFLVGGGEVLSDPLYIAFEKLGVLAKDAQVGLDLAALDGMRIGEGAAYLCVERLAAARDRGARAHGYLVGYGTAFEPPASDAMLVHVSSDAVRRALTAALEDAGLEPAQVDVVCSGASGIRSFDEAELAGITAVFGSEMAVAGPKLMWGETFGAGGALGLAAGLAWLSGAPAGPLLRGRAPAAARHVVVLTPGYYGNASAAVLVASAPESSRSRA